MILPQSQLGTLLVMILSLLCLGLWVNTYRLTGRVRFEIYYIDFTLVLVIAAAIYALTVGNMGFDGFSILDDIMNASKRPWILGFGAGLVFTIGNMFLMAAISVTGISLAFPMAMGLALAVSFLLGQMGKTTVNPIFLAVGCVLVLLAILVDALAHQSAIRRRRADLAAAGKTKRSAAPGAVKGILLCVVSGLLLVLPDRLMSAARVPENGLGPYGAMTFFALGAFAAITVCSLFFMNLPVEGEPLGITDYLRTTIGRHLLGIVGGIIWATGAMGILVAGAVEPEARISPAETLAFSNGGIVIAALCGLVLWRELREAGTRARLAAWIGLLLLAGGLACLVLSLRAS